MFFHLLVQLFEPAGDETARAASKVRHRFADLRPDRLRHEISDGARRIEFAGGTGTLQLFEDGFIDVAEGVALLVVAQIQLVDDVDDLTQQHAVLHVVVGIGERRLHDGLLDRRIGGDGQRFERWEKRVVYEVQQRIARHSLARMIVCCPVLPTACLREDGFIVVIVPFPVLLLGVVHFEKEHPRNLLDALRITVDARVVAHDVAQPLDESRKVVHVFNLPLLRKSLFPVRAGRGDSHPCRRSSWRSWRACPAS